MNTGGTKEDAKWREKGRARGRERHDQRKAVALQMDKKQARGEAGRVDARPAVLCSPHKE